MPGGVLMGCAAISDQTNPVEAKSFPLRDVYATVSKNTRFLKQILYPWPVGVSKKTNNCTKYKCDYIF